MNNEKRQWCIDQHEKCNHKYADYLPYRFHLEMVCQVFKDFRHLLPKDLITEEFQEYGNHWVKHDITNYVIETSCYSHDTIEDTNNTYNDVKQHLGADVANITYALTNEKGKTRTERANDKYYEGIRNTPGATFVKLCDRIANVRFGKLTKSKMFDGYKKENPNFMSKLGYNASTVNGLPLNWNENDEKVDYLIPMFQYLEGLFND